MLALLVFVWFLFSIALRLLCACFSRYRLMVKNTRRNSHRWDSDDTVTMRDGADWTSRSVNSWTR